MHKDATVCRFRCTICSFRCHIAVNSFIGIIFSDSHHHSCSEWLQALCPIPFTSHSLPADFPFERRELSGRRKGGGRDGAKDGSGQKQDQIKPVEQKEDEEGDQE